MGYSADKSPLIGHLAGPTRRLEPLGAQRQEKGGPNHLTREGLHATTPFFEVTANTLVHRRSTLLLLQDGHLTFFESNLAIGRTISNGLLHLRQENS